MNLFYLAQDMDECARYHIDRHVGKMILEAAQLLTSALWIDKHLGYIPRKLEIEEFRLITELKQREPAIDDRKFTRYLPTHINHPCAIWVRSSMDNYEWATVYANALNEEGMYRGYKHHSSCTEVNRMPDPSRLPYLGLTRHEMAMPDILKSEDVIESYRLFYMLDKGPFATWKRREPPPWWNQQLVSEQAGRITR